MKRILLVDDEPDVRDVVSTRLRAQNYDVIPAADGVEALEQLDRRPVDLLILDLMMPRLDGMALLRRLRERRAPRPPVLVLSAYGIPGIPEAARALGADDYLPKPFGGVHLEAKVKLLLGAMPAEAPARPSLLLIDGDPAHRRELADRLEWLGYAVQSAGEWKTGIRLAQIERPDLILLDLDHPEIGAHAGCFEEGHDWSGKEIPVIMLAGRDAPETREKARRLGADALIVKPVSWADLLGHLRRLVDRPCAPAQ
jgi:DNA-binding response OmpR family regulator